MRKSLSLVLMTALMFSFGCYHASIETGKPASSKTITNNWATGWIAGLVAPETVKTAAECADGVAKVETSLSFMNMLVSGLTFNIYAPMTIKVTCAAGSMSSMEEMIVVPENATDDEITKAVQKAASQSFLTDKPVGVQFTSAP